MTRNILEPTAAELDLIARVAELEADVITLSENGTLDLSDRDDSLGRLGRQLSEEALRDAEDRMWAEFQRTGPIGRAASLAEAFVFPPGGGGLGLDEDDTDPVVAGHAADWEVSDG